MADRELVRVVINERVLADLLAEGMTVARGIAADRSIDIELVLAPRLYAWCRHDLMTISSPLRLVKP